MHWRRSQGSIKGLTRSFRVLDADTKKLRRHIDDEVLRPSSEPPLLPPVLDDVAPKLIDPIMEYLAEQRSVKFLKARAVKAALKQLIKTEHADVERSIVLVYALLSEAVRRGRKIRFKFERYCSIDGSLATLDKLRKAVEKRESTPGIGVANRVA
ncbi:hypothetical protein B5M09_010405 [Aphanomyces astaci]|uniref:Uncharacterized protein n=1 Tax=Aphanomyces astaci TaxID=112090 RepID=A0A3R7YTB9_APHAT|nr:hypothetical protein B5M09_010405 [Aphanomyces astaci]